MNNRNSRPAIAFAFAAAIVVAVLALSFASTTWAAPGAQGTVPTRQRPTTEATSAPGQPTTPPDNGGGNNGGDNGGNNGGDNGGNNGGDNSGNNGGNGGGQGAGTESPTAAPGTGTVCGIGDSGAQCTAPDVVVLVSGGAAAAGSALTIEGPFGQPPCPASPTGVNFMNRCYRYSWIGTDVQPLTEIKAPIEYCITYGADQLAAVGNKPENLLIGWAGADGKWTLVKPTIDTAANRTCATSNQIAAWTALFASQTATNLLPTVGGQQNLLWIVPIGLLGAFMLLGAWRLTRKPR